MKQKQKLGAGALSRRYNQPGDGTAVDIRVG